ncbi:MAG: hypothetical protein Q7T26_07515 [Dehalococcoidia bacterium]|nr:hypothetical protein [Dehalococcoidia bacterium]
MNLPPSLLVDSASLASAVQDSITTSPITLAREGAPERWLVSHIENAIKRLNLPAIIEKEVNYPRSKERLDMVLKFHEGEVWVEAKYFAAGADANKKDTFKRQTHSLAEAVRDGVIKQALAIAIFDFYTENRVKILLSEVIVGDIWAKPHVRLSLDRRSPIAPSLPVWLVVTNAAT